jgi:hypothetical protein
LDSQRRPWYLNPWLHLALILVVAGFFRLWQIGSLPPGLFGDESTDGLDALDVLAGRGAVFFPANFGREGLHIWLVAGAFRLLGVTPLALRLPSVLAGILTGLATYWLGCELVAAWKRRTREDQGLQRTLLSFIPLIAGLYVSTSYWHIHFSRFGIRGVFTPLCAALAFAAFWRAINLGDKALGYPSPRIESAPGMRSAQLPASRARGGPVRSANRPAELTRRAEAHTIDPSSLAWFALSGLFLGLSLHFYTASRFLPFFLAGFLALEWLSARLRGRQAESLWSRYWRSILLLYVVAGLVFAPLALYFLQHPGSFSQRASAVTALGSANPLERMVQAALANVSQFFVPGSGDTAQFYNLPGRAVFDPFSAILALLGILTLLWFWRQPVALFLLAWWPALLLPSFLATDRFPTLPRVLGTIPGVFFFPAAGVALLGAGLAWVVNRLLPTALPHSPGTQAETVGPTGPGSWFEGTQHSSVPPFLRTAAPLLAVGALALLIQAGLTYRDYFGVWASSPATFDAFEGDMMAASGWLAANNPPGHVYLSSDIYRHPTFMLLHEQSTVTSYFQQHDPQLSWFDARVSLPLPAPDQPATYLIAASSPAEGLARDILARDGTVRDQVLGPDGKPVLTVVELQPSPATVGATGAINFTAHLRLTGAAWAAGSDTQPELRLRWRTSGPQPEDWAGYRLELAGQTETGADWQASVPFDGFRAPEWVVGGGFLTSHTLDLAGVQMPRVLRLRLVHADSGEPLNFGAVSDGWHQVIVQ